MTRRESLDVRIKRLVAIETSHRHTLRRAEEDLRRDVLHRAKHERRIAKTKRKIEKLLPKLRALRELRSSTK